jgi:hypothetical protein
VRRRIAAAIWRATRATSLGQITIGASRPLERCLAIAC